MVAGKALESLVLLSNGHRACMPRPMWKELVWGEGLKGLNMNCIHALEKFAADPIRRSC